MKKLLVLLLTLILSFALVACGTEDAGGEEDTESTATADTGEEAEGEDTDQTAAEPTEGEKTEVVIEHDLGETTVSKNPETIVVFDYGMLESLDKMGVEVTAVPKGNIPTYLSKYDEDTYENAGSLFEPDFEKISDLNPDLILISGRQMDHYDELSKLGPTVFVSLDTVDYFASFSENMRMLGSIFAQEDFIESELSELENAIIALNEKTEEVENALIILANDGNISAYGPGSRFGIIHGDFGITPVDEGIEVSTHGMNVTFEYIAEMDPEYLFVVDRGAIVGGESSAEQILDNDLTKGTRAFENGNVVYLDPVPWYVAGGGLVSVSEMIKSVESALE
ncbi:siderophore ABC transporter substrate-binding protein [Evansella tamaricis]|uniref:Siderophore ABC transporter substrate-binding protein n=1 Tax=Evansella tamaricis TaxID=2069301 RepID=A0ABS6JM26_9BACI|nr:siderophore ABC transporter substrate-binding protein [Evansella tamaricis]MBU9713902.1 siderophore ABC transporter substrate-binding protein [Evansella tamaricis]